MQAYLKAKISDVQVTCNQNKISDMQVAFNLIQSTNYAGEKNFDVLPFKHCIVSKYCLCPDQVLLFAYNSKHTEWAILFENYTRLSEINII